MHIIFFNNWWMLWNLFLAIIALFPGLAMLYYRSKYIKLFFAFLWLLFIPNAIYLVTDLYHLTYQWYGVSTVVKPLLVFQYLGLAFVGVCTHVFGVFLAEKLLQGLKVNKSSIPIWIVLLNFLISFGVIMGRVQRTNSWELFTNLKRVISDAMTVLFSIELMIYVLAFWIFSAGVYFIFRNRCILFFNRTLKVLMS